MTYDIGDKIFVPIDQYTDLCEFFQKKTKGQQYIRRSRALIPDFHELLHKILEENKEEEDTDDPFPKFLIFLKDNQKGLTRFDFLQILRKTGTVTLPPSNSLFKKIEADTNERNLKILNLFFRRFYLKAIELFQESCEEYKLDQLLPYSKVLYYIEDLFRNELIFKDDGVELFILKNFDKARIYFDVYLYDYLRLDKYYYENLVLMESGFTYDQIIDFLHWLVSYTDTMDVNFVYRFEDDENESGFSWP